MHFPDGDGLRDGVDGRGEEARPGRKEVRKLRGSLEVFGEGECCERCQDSLLKLSTQLALCNHRMTVRERKNTIAIQT